MRARPRTASAPAWALPVLLLALAAALLLSLMVGAKPLSPSTVLSALFAPDLSLPDHGVVWDGRVPRTLLGLLAGVAIGVAGALMQGLTRNPLADPGLLGINAGASFAVVLAVGVLGLQSLYGYVWFAFLGALLAAAVVYLVGRSGRGSDPLRLVLAGVAFSAVLEGVGQGLALVNPQAFDRLRTWSVGTLDIGSLQPVLAVSGFVLAGLILAVLATRGLNAVALGEDAATALGVSVRATRLLSLAAVVLLAGSAAATAGVIVFLGLMVPHLARRLCGPDNRWVAALSALIAPAVLLVADVIGRLILPGELAAGIVVAFIGAPFLILIARQRKVIEL